MLEKISFDHEERVQEWDAFVKADPQGTPYHMSGWIKAIQ
jgi:hypothetical protein